MFVTPSIRRRAIRFRTTGCLYTCERGLDTSSFTTPPSPLRHPKHPHPSRFFKHVSALFEPASPWHHRSSFHQLYLFACMYLSTGLLMLVRNGRSSLSHCTGSLGENMVGIKEVGEVGGQHTLGLGFGQRAELMGWSIGRCHRSI